MSEVEIVLSLNLVVGEFVGEDETHAAGLAIRRNQISARNFRLFAAVESERRNFERFSVGAKNCPAPFVKPFRWNTNLSGRWTSAFNAPLIHAHAVGDDGGFI